MRICWARWLELGAVAGRTSDMGKTYMHDLPQPRKATLTHYSIARGISGLPSTGSGPMYTHRCKYAHTPQA